MPALGTQGLQIFGLPSLFGPAFPGADSTISSEAASWYLLRSLNIIFFVDNNSGLVWLVTKEERRMFWRSGSEKELSNILWISYLFSNINDNKYCVLTRTFLLALRWCQALVLNSQNPSPWVLGLWTTPIQHHSVLEIYFLIFEISWCLMIYTLGSIDSMHHTFNNN